MSGGGYMVKRKPLALSSFVLSLLILLLLFGCGDRYYQLEVKNHQSQRLLVSVSDTDKTLDLPACGSVGRLNGYWEGEHLTVRASLPDGQTVYSKSFVLGHANGGVQNLTVDVPANQANGCAS